MRVIKSITCNSASVNIYKNKLKRFWRIEGKNMSAAAAAARMLDGNVNGAK